MEEEEAAKKKDSHDQDACKEQEIHSKKDKPKKQELMENKAENGGKDIWDEIVDMVISKQLSSLSAILTRHISNMMHLLSAYKL